MPRFFFSALVVALSMASAAAIGAGLPSLANPSIASAPVQMQQQRKPLIIAPTVEGLLLCDAAAVDLAAASVEAAQTQCRKQESNGAAALTRLLDTLEPGGAKGQVQVGYTITLQLLALYQRTAQGWAIDTARIDEMLRLITQVPRPVVLYLAADHFDSVGPLAQELLKDPRNLMQLANGQAPELGYFGYRIVPYTLLTDASIPANRYRYEALHAVAQRVQALPKEAQERIVAYTLAGELHQMFPDFENGMGAFQDVQATDYSSASIAAFRRWLQVRYQSIETFNAYNVLNYASFDDVPAPAKDIRRDKLTSFGEHYDAFADGMLPLSGWLWDPQNTISALDVYVDGRPVGPVGRNLNRLDVYRAVDDIDSPNVGFRHDLDFRTIAPGRHRAQIVAQAQGRKHSVAEVEFTVVARDQSRVSSAKPATISGLKDAKALPGVRFWLDLPKPQQDVYFNPLARDWNTYRAVQVRQFLEEFHRRALQAGLPADKLYSHQIVPDVNSSWNRNLFAAQLTFAADVPWKQGLNLYGGATDSPWVREFFAQRKITDYGVPEFNPQQWKRSGVHLSALQSHYDAGARFVSPYYFSLIPERFKGGEQSVNRMELGPKNAKDGSDRFYKAIVEFAKR